MIVPVADLRPPYYAVVFTSLHTGEKYQEYQQMALRMNELAREQDGFLGIESAAGALEDLRITVSYWRDLAAIAAWRDNAEHRIAQQKGKSLWYRHYRLRICHVEREYGR